MSAIGMDGPLVRRRAVALDGPAIHLGGSVGSPWRQALTASGCAIGANRAP